MFRQIKLTVLCLMLAAATAASQEFEEFENGLMYDESTMARLEYIVDSLNLQFMQCQLDRSYFAEPQATGHYIRIFGGNVKQARLDIESGHSFDEIAARYDSSHAHKNLLIAVEHQTGSEPNENVRILRGAPFEKTYDNSLYTYGSRENLKMACRNSWEMQYSPESKYCGEYLVAFFFTSDFTTPEIPASYARMVQYVDCMVDTSTRIHDSGMAQRKPTEKEGQQLHEFSRWVIEETATPRSESESQDSLSFWNLNELRLERVNKYLLPNPQFLKRLEENLQLAREVGAGDELLEWLAQHFSSKEIALQFKRSRRVVGMCSHDAGPREHTREIAILSAETAKWEVFLRAHLDIMNDNFSRVSDGSYAWGRRKTYIRELEELNINVPELILGTVLRIGNHSENHYFGSVQRLGRAIAETRNREEFESHMNRMMGDSSLDDYNRLLIFYLYKNFTYHLDDKKVKQTTLKRLASAIATMPPYLAERLQPEYD